MKKVILAISILLSTSYISQAQVFYTDDTSNTKNIPINPLAITNVPVITFTATTSSNYSFSIEKDGDIIDYNETILSKGETYIIDMTVYTIGRYKIKICNLQNNVKYEYFYIKNNENEIK